MKTPTLSITSAILISLGLSCVALSPQAKADCQQGCLTQANTVLGEDALFSVTGGNSDTAVGSWALYSNTEGSENTAIGTYAMYWNTTGLHNTAIGYDALVQNTTGDVNVAVGDSALESNTTGNGNTAVGDFVLALNTTGGSNVAIGDGALSGNTIGNYNTASGENALAYNKGGNNNTAAGYQALFNNTSGSFNIAIGNGAGGNLTTGINNIDIGNDGVAGESKTIRIGSKPTQKNTYIAGISGVTVAGGINVVVDTSGHLGTVTSSGRYKKNIQPMKDASDKILSLHPVTFEYNDELDPQGVPQFGLVAEDVAKVDPALVARDDEGKPYTVRYEAVNAMLLNEFLKEHKKVEEQAKTAHEQASRIETQAKEISDLKSALKDVTARLDAKGL